MPLIEVHELTKSYDDKIVVDGISSLWRREVFAILGPNGAGKTTTVESIAGLRTPDSGRIAVFGFNPLVDRAEVRSRLGVQLQESRFQDRVKVSEVVETFAAQYPDPLDGPTLLERLGLSEKADTQYARLSGGQQQRVSIAVALVGRPRAVILDELTTGLDPQVTTGDLGAGRGTTRRRRHDCPCNAFHRGGREAGGPFGLDRRRASRRSRYSAGPHRQRRIGAAHPVTTPKESRTTR